MNLLSLNTSGLQDWLLQRITAVILTAYIGALGGYALLYSPLDFLAWQRFFYHPFMQIFGLLSLISLCIHTWLGLWMVVTDYIKYLPARLMVNSFLLLTLFIYLIWGITILWHI